MTGGIPKLEIRPRILVIDDNEILARSFVRMLRTYDVSVEHDPAQAVARMLSGEHFDVVLCDLRMPNMSGLEVLTAIRNYYAGRTGMPHMCMMSGGDELSEQDLATPVLAKPCTATDVRSMVTRLLEAAAA